MKLASTFALTAIAAATAISSAIPAEAINVSRGTGPSFTPTGVITFGTPSPGSYSAFNENYGGATVIGTKVSIREDDEESTSPFFRLQNASNSTASFNFSNKTEAFGFLLVSSNFPEADFNISFFQNGSNTQTFSLAELIGTVGTGNYFNFVSSSESDYFDRVVFSRLAGNLSIDNAAFQVVPTPALLPGIIGMGIAAIKKRRDGALEETEADAEA